MLDAGNGADQPGANLNRVSSGILRQDYKRFWNSPNTGGHVLRAVFGTESRFITRIYLQRAIVLSLVTIAIVVALDVSINVERFMSDEKIAKQQKGLLDLLKYAVLRVSFVAPSVLFFAGVWGIVWAEHSLSISRERIMIFNCGRSYLPSLIPALLVGAIIGALHFVSTASSN